jgi:hypothetical protein
MDGTNGICSQTLHIHPGVSLYVPVACRLQFIAGHLDGHAQLAQCH